tara:strand:- start:565 stop:1314 length:750 start_codon:yes stop_codon:yes gene_type:complete
MGFYVGPKIGSSIINPETPILWLNAGAGVNGGTAVDGNAVYEWADQSGHGNDFIQTTASAQPIYYASVIGSRPGVAFVSDLLSHTGNLFNTIGASFFTIYVVIELLEITDAGTVNQRKTLMRFGPSGWSGTPPGSWNIGLEGAISTNGAGYQKDINYTYGNYGQTILSPPDLNPHYISILSHGISYIDGVQVNAGTGGALLISGGQNYIGGWNNSKGQFNLSEMIIYDKKHTDAQRLGIEKYLKDKYTL